MPRWPGRPGAGDAPAYVCFSAQDWWYHNRAHSDFQLMRRSAADHRKVLVVNSIGMRMPTPGRSTHTTRRIAPQAAQRRQARPAPAAGPPWFPRHVAAAAAALRLTGAAGDQRRASCAPRSGVVRLLWRIAPARSVDGHDPDRDGTSCGDGRSRRWCPTGPTGTPRSPRRDRRHRGARAPTARSTPTPCSTCSRSRLMAEERDPPASGPHFLDHGVDVDHFRSAGRTELPVDLRRSPAHGRASSALWTTTSSTSSCWSTLAAPRSRRVASC